MKAPQQIEYQEDVNQLTRIWKQIKSPKKSMCKKQGKNVNSSQSRTNYQSKIEVPSEKKLRVIVSDHNLKRTVRNQKQKGEVIEVVTHPQKTIQGDNIKKTDRNTQTHTLPSPNQQKQHLIDCEQLKRTLAKRDHQISLLEVSNAHNQDKIRRLQASIEKKQAKIEELHMRERQLSNQLSALASKDINFNYGKVEYQNYRQDSRRLLTILKSTTEYHYFAEMALEDDGIRFLTNANQSIKTKLDVPASQSHFHFCSCNKAFISEPFLWVPQKAYNYGRQFVRERQGELSQSQLELLLYELNKIWREREKRIINHLNSIKVGEMAKQKRTSMAKQRIPNNQE